LLLAWTGVLRGGLKFELGADAVNRTGRCLFIFALAVQPLIGPLLGRSWTEAEIFGVAPDPTAIATLGALLITGRVRWRLLLVPVLWCAIGGATLWTMESSDAVVLPAAAVLAIAAAIWRAASGRAR
jgi:hypothetical protein